VAVLLFAPYTWKRQALVAIGTAVIFSGVAFIILLIAPGNQVRRSRFPEGLSLSSLVNFTLDQSGRFLRRSSWFAVPALMGAAMGILWLHLRQTGHSTRPRWLAFARPAGLAIYISIAVLGLIAACLFAAGYAMTYAPPPRAYIVPRYGLILGASGIGFCVAVLSWRVVSLFLGNPFEQRVSRVVTFGMAGLTIAAAVVVAITFTQDTLQDSERMARFAQAWDALDARLQAEAAGASVVVEPFPVEFAEMVGVNRITVRAPSNSCVADFYGLASVRASR
jgi:hypothetical protein